MTHAERAALRVFGLRELPKTEDELNKVYRKMAKRTHPDSFGTRKVSDMPIKRVYKARDVLIDAIRERGKPKVFVKFGDGDARQATVVENCFYNSDSTLIGSIESCKHVVTLKWFMGLTVCVNGSEYRDVCSPEEFAMNGVFVRCI